MANSKAFTLIELIIVIGIISIFAGLSLAYYNNQNDISKLKSEAQKFVDVFDLTRKKAMTSEKTDNCTLVNYSIIITANSYTVSKNQTGDSCISISQNYPINPYTIIAGMGTIDIQPLYGTLSTDSTITIRNQNKCIDINITSSGSNVAAPTTCQ